MSPDTYAFVLSSFLGNLDPALFIHDPSDSITRELVSEGFPSRVCSARFLEHTLILWRRTPQVELGQEFVMSVPTRQYGRPTSRASKVSPACPMPYVIQPSEQPEFGQAQRINVEALIRLYESGDLKPRQEGETPSDVSTAIILLRSF
jgi:hypothetical protein